MAELLSGRPLFTGKTSTDQLVEIIKVLGTPSKDEIFSMNKNYSEFNFPDIAKRSWEKVLGLQCPSDGVDLISKILVFNPSERLDPITILSHPFFDELRDRPKRTLPNGRSVLFTLPFFPPSSLYSSSSFPLPSSLFPLFFFSLF